MDRWMDGCYQFTSLQTLFVTVCTSSGQRAREQGLFGCCFLHSPGGWKEQMSVCTVSCQVGPEQGSHRHKAPNGVTKDVQEAPLRLGEPQRVCERVREREGGGRGVREIVSPSLPVRGAVILSTRGRMVAAESCATLAETVRP